MSAETAGRIKKAVEYHSLASKQGLLERLFTLVFDGFVYNQIWEDPRVDLEALQVDANSRMLTIASGGCNLLNYLIAQPAAVHAVDLNPHHIHFTTLKLAAFRHLPSYEALYDFYGFADKASNLDNYKRFLLPNLPDETRRFWEEGSWLRGPRIEYFTRNIYRYGAMAYFIRLTHWFCARYDLKPATLLEEPDPEKRERLFEREFEPFFNFWMIKLLGRMPFLFYGLGIPPQQFDAMRKESNGKLERLYSHRMKRLACQFSIEENYFAWQAFSQRYDHERRQAIPDYLKEEHYDGIKANLDRISLNYCSLTEYIKNQPEGGLNRFVFLDSQDWMDAPTLTELWSEVDRVGPSGSRVIFRTASDESPIETALPPELRDKFVYEEETSRRLFAQDRSAIYGGFHLYVKR